jgi:putative DNA primase/helicase
LFGCTRGAGFVNRGAALSSAANYDDVLRQLRGEGLLPEEPLEIGTTRPKRCRVDGDRERRGWYWLHEFTTSAGAVLIVGTFGVWHGNEQNTSKVELKREHSDPLTTEQRDALKARMRRDRQAAEAARKAEAARAAARADKVWRACLPAGASDYLERKAVQPWGVKFTSSGAVVVPMLDVQGRVHGLQFILPAGHPRRKKTGRDKEYWPAGLAKRGRHFVLGVIPQVGGVVLLCEGYATAASLFEATGLPTVVAFDAGNLLPVAEAIAGRYKRARILVCADDDYLSDGNPGATAAAAAAHAVGGAFLLPVFADRDRDRDGKSATDFNDLHCREGLHQVRAQVETQLRQQQWHAQGQGAASHAPRGSGGDGGDEQPPESFRFDMDVLLQRFTLIYGTDTAFDDVRRVIIGLGPLRSAAGKSLVRMWLEHPARKTVLPDQVGFDPACTNPQVVCNLWGGWPTVPQQGGCDALLRILQHLCSREDKPRDVYRWVLKWLAYPLQHPGAKMQTALLMHGPEGTGKNTVFGAVRQAYGRYGFTFTQVELESQFNGIFSGKLFGIGNEVVSRAELYHQQGRMRNMITEGEWPINEKNLPARMEQNHCNMVFFSNRIDIAKLDPDDRRYCVIWTPDPADPALYLEAKAELQNGGAAALHWHLLNEVSLDGFDEHSKPPMTRAKRDLIGLGMDSTERFWREWSEEHGELRELYMPCTSAQLYSAYQLFCRRLGVGKPAQQDTLSTVLGKKPGLKLDRREARVGGTKRLHRVVLTSGLHDPPDHFDGSKLDWMTGCIEEFATRLDKMQDDGLLPQAANKPARKAGGITEEEAANYGRS